MSLEGPQPIKVGLVGSGVWARNGHARLYNHPEFEVVGVWSPNTRNRKDTARELRIHPHDSFEELMSEVDLLSFSVPPRRQYELACVAALHKKAMLLEKPLATSSDFGQSLIERLQESTVSALVDLPYLFADCIEHAKQLKNAGARRFSLEMESPLYDESSWLAGFEIEQGILPHALYIADELAGGLQQLNSDTWSATQVEFEVVGAEMSGTLSLRAHAESAMRNTLTMWLADASVQVVDLAYGDDMFQRLGPAVATHVREQLGLHETVFRALRVQEATDQLKTEAVQQQMSSGKP